MMKVRALRTPCLAVLLVCVCGMVVGGGTGRGAGPDGWQISWDGKAIVLRHGDEGVARVENIRVVVGGATRDVLGGGFEASGPEEVLRGGYRMVFSRGGGLDAETVEVGVWTDGNEVWVFVDVPRNPEQVGEIGGTVTWGKDPWLCRVEPASNPDVVQTALGEMVENARCDAAFDRFGDRVLRARADRVEWRKRGGELALRVTGRLDAVLGLTAIPNYYRERLGIRFYEPIDNTVKKRFPGPVSGWCSWYDLYQDINEENILANAKLVAERLKPFGAEYVQIDDGWQGVGHGGGENRDWLSVAPGFGHGMPRVANEIRKMGLKSGLWLIPQGQSNWEFVKDRRDAFLWTKEGQSPFCKVDDQGRVSDAAWQGAFLVDPTSPAAPGYLRSLMRGLAVDWGYDYFKIDGQPTTNEFYADQQSLMARPEVQPDEAYRMSLRAIRDAIGPQRFLLGCYGIPLSGIGIMDGSRTGGDVGGDWGGFQPALDATMRWYFLHNVAWYCDPDALLVRPPLTIDQARAWATLYAITGQHLMASDDLRDLPEERFPILQSVFPALNIRPVDLYAYARPRLWDLKVNHGGDSCDVVAAFNWDTAPISLRVTFKDLGLTAAKEYDVFEFWTWRYLGRLKKTFEPALPPTSVRVFVVREALDRPQVMTTSRHVVAGYVDEVETTWDAGAKCLRGRSNVGGGFPYKVAIITPWQRSSFVATSARVRDGKADLEQAGPLVSLRWTPQESGVVEWRVDFTVRPVAQATSLPAPSDLKVEQREGSLTLSWQPVTGASFYRVYCDGVLCGAAWDPEFADTRLGFAKRTYFVKAVGYDGRESEPSASVEFTPAAAEMLWLDQVQPASASQDWGTLHMNASVEGNPLSIGGVRYQRGLGTHAHSTLIYKLDGAFRTFAAHVGVDDEKGGAGSVVFEVRVDGREAFDSGVMRGGEPAKEVVVPLAGVKELQLYVDCADDGISCDHADWAEARLLAR